MPWLIQNSSPWRRVFKLNCLSVVALTCVALFLLPTPHGKWVFYHLQGLAWRRNLELREGGVAHGQTQWFQGCSDCEMEWPCHGHHTHLPPLEQESDKQLGACTSDSHRPGNHMLFIRPLSVMFTWSPGSWSPLNFFSKICHHISFVVIKLIYLRIKMEPKMQWSLI